MKKRTCKFLSATLALVLTISSMAMSVGAEELPIETEEVVEVVVEEPTEEVSEEVAETVEEATEDTEDASEVVAEATEEITEATEEVSETTEEVSEEVVETTEEAVVEEAVVEAVEAVETAEDAIAPLDLDAETEEVVEDGAAMYSYVDKTLTIGNAGVIEAKAWEAKYGSIADECETIIIEDQITEIGGNAFKDFTALKEVVIGSDVKIIGDGAFQGCNSEDFITVSIPKNVTKIGARAFKDCAHLETVTFVEATDEQKFTIGDEAFSGCEVLDEVIISRRVKSIGESSFAGCVNLETLTINRGITSIGANAFNGCVKLNGIFIPKTITSIGKTAFLNCTKLITAGPAPDDDSTPYDVSYENGVVTNCSWFKTFPTLENIVIPKTITNLTIEAEAFKDNDVLTNVTIENDVKTIEASAFENCTKLEEVVMPTNKTLTTVGEKAFKGCLILKTLNTQSITSYGAEAFYQCYKLNTVKINDKVTNIPDKCFYECTEITSTIDAPINSQSSTLAGIGLDAFNGCVKIEYMFLPKTMNVGNSAFAGCTSLERVDIKEGATVTLGEKVFLNDGSLAKININGGLASVGTNAFVGCVKLVTLANNDTIFGADTETTYATNIKYNFPAEVPDGLFRNIPSLTAVAVPNGVTKIGKEAFAECSSLVAVALSDTVQVIDEKAFYECSALEDIARVDNSGNLKGIGDYPNNIPKGITTIGAYAFAEDGLLETFELPETLRTIGNYAFRNDTSLSTVGDPDEDFTIPNGVTKIGSYAFEGCTGLVDLASEGKALPDTITSIGKGAFKNCTALEQIYICPNATTLGEKIFAGDKATLKIYGFLDTKAETYADTYNYDFYTVLIKYNIIFDANGGTGSTTNMQNVSSNTEYTLSANGFKKSGYTFKGWNTAKNGTGKAYANKATVMNLTYEGGKDVVLYAQWTAGTTTPTTTPTKTPTKTATKTPTKTATKTPTTLPSSGWVKTSSGKWKYKLSDGTYAKSCWLSVNGKYYHFGSDGIMQTGWIKLSSKWYYLASSGARTTGWQKVSGKWYYMNSSGVMQTGWVKVSGKWYYLASSGAMQTGWIKLNNKWYYLVSSGEMVTGWQLISKKWYYFVSSGEMQTGWITLNKVTYYLSSSGAMVTGWQKIGNYNYYFMSSGRMLTSTFFTQNGKTYYFLPNGMMATGWQKIGSYYYYFYPDGHMAINTTVNGYRVDSQGRLVG